MSKKIFAFVLSLVMIVSIAAFSMPASAADMDKVTVALDFAFAPDENGGHNYYWKVSEKLETLYVDFEGRSFDFDDIDNDVNAQNYDYTLKLEKENAQTALAFNTKNIVIGDNVTYLGNGMFDRYFAVENIFVPDSVVEIGKDVFPANTNTVIHCSKDSVAIKSAVEAGLAFDTNAQVEAGDANADGNIAMNDVLIIRKLLAKWQTGYEVNAVDCNADTKVNMADVLLLRKYLAKWDVTLGK